MTTRRRDGLPEATTYRDTGCSASPSCLACPLPLCRYDSLAPGRFQHAEDVSSLLRSTREAMGLTQAQLAARLDVEQTTISGWEAGTRVMRWPGMLRLALESLVARME